MLTFAQEISYTSVVGLADASLEGTPPSLNLSVAHRASTRQAPGEGAQTHTVGFRPTPGDGFPMIGRPQDREGLYLAVMHSGITLAPAAGLFTAGELLDGKRDPLIVSYHPDRLRKAP